MHLYLYDENDHTAARLEQARAAVEKAAQLQPDAGEVHLVWAHYLFRGLRKYGEARAELELARRSLPNDSAVYFETAVIDRRQGRADEALRNFNRAIELDPRNIKFLTEAGTTCVTMRRYAEATQIYQRLLNLSPQDNSFRLDLANLAFCERADIRPFRVELNALVAHNSTRAREFARSLWLWAILERDAAAADRALAAMPAEGFHGYLGHISPKEWYVGYTARLFNRPEMARQALTSACHILEGHLREQPDDALSWASLSAAKGLLGQRQETIAAAKRASEIWPLSKEPIWGMEVLRLVASAYALLGDRELALPALALCVTPPSNISYGDLKLGPDWDSLRGDPRFEKLVASLAPKDP
jgi:tetratricopeptide (TPR) repeat protein